MKHGRALEELVAEPSIELVVKVRDYGMLAGAVREPCVFAKPTCYLGLDYIELHWAPTRGVMTLHSPHIGLGCVNRKL